MSIVYIPLTKNDAIRRHLLRHKTDREPPRPTMATMLETKNYHENPT